MVTVVGFLAPAVLLLAVLGVTALTRIARDRVRAANRTVAAARAELATPPTGQPDAPLPVKPMPLLPPPGYLMWTVDLTGVTQSHLWLQPWRDQGRHHDAP